MVEPIEPVKGAAFPFRIDPRSGGVATTEGPAKIKENLAHLLLSRAGERVMLREYGGGVSQLFQENINDGLIAVARLQIGGAMLRFEPRALPQEVHVVDREGELLLVVAYLQAGVPNIQSVAIALG
jgi:phage baseplate assembly protein W